MSGENSTRFAFINVFREKLELLMTKYRLNSKGLNDLFSLFFVCTTTKSHSISYDFGASNKVIDIPQLQTYCQAVSVIYSLEQVNQSFTDLIRTLDTFSILLNNTIWSNSTYFEVKESKMCLYHLTPAKMRIEICSYALSSSLTTLIKRQDTTSLGYPPYLKYFWIIAMVETHTIHNEIPVILPLPRKPIVDDSSSSSSDSDSD